MVFGAYVVIGVWQFRNACATRRRAALLRRRATRSTSPSSRPRWWAPASASCGGTRRRRRSSWATPARSRSAARWPASRSLTRTELLLLLLGGLFVVITLSVILQVGSFKLTGRRVFLMAPLQHHFELRGWGEVTIVIRFWIIAGLCVGLGLGIFYAEWVAGGTAVSACRRRG